MARGHMVMGLAQLVGMNSSYVSDYVNSIQKLAIRNKFVIMDNGANEGALPSFEELEQRAAYLGANELVLPDVLGNSTETLVETTQFLKHRSTQLESYMAVVQGTNKKELRHLVDAYASNTAITTLGLPRLLITRVSQACRIDMANWIADEYPNRFALHLLGASSAWVKEPLYAARYAIQIRSIDTSLPYNYGLRGICIDRVGGVPAIDRATNYFSTVHTQNQLTTISHNEEVYKEWCSDVTHSPSVKSVH